jgi:hypothetical protein
MCALRVKLVTAEAMLNGKHDKPYNNLARRKTNKLLLEDE